MGSGLILGIESSCDETAAAVVERGGRTLSSVVASQIATHARYGGVVPELASREHLRAIVPVVRAALEQAGIGLGDLEAIAVTSGPGLAGALLVGITYAKALAFAQGIPLIAVNHLEGHIHAVLLHEREGQAQVPVVGGEPAVEVSHPSGKNKDAARVGHPAIEQPQVLRLPSAALRVAQDDSSVVNQDEEPALALVVSGGHTHLYLARPTAGSWSYRLVGRTVDDAAGEAYDKVAKLLGLGYPGGPWIDGLARFGDARAVPFAFSQIKTKVHLGGKAPRTKAAKTAPIAELDPRLMFSFSGIKTAVLRYVELHGLREGAQARAAAVRSGAGVPQTKEEAVALCGQTVLDLVASFQRAVVGDLMKKTFAAAEKLGTKRILVTGGVAANRELRERFTVEAARRGVRVAFPTLALSTDNAAMIAAAAWPRFVAGEFAAQDLSADPSLALGALALGR
jgi:N6-L-threonylcarbamoyladenine synthase